MSRNLTTCILSLFLIFTSVVRAGTNQDLRREIGQMFIVGFKGIEVNKTSFISKAIKDLNLGGVLLFGYNIENPAQVKKLCTALQNLSEIPLIISIDAEGGVINRLKPEYGFLDIPSHQKLGKLNDTKKTYEIITPLAQQLSGLGINTNFAPVVDVNINPQNPVIAKYGRSFSSAPRIVSQQAEAFIKAHRNKGILTAIKHFPGHGSSSGDTHLGLTDVTETYSSSELLPFKTLIGKGLVDLVMTSHIVNRNFDEDYPVTLSKYYINSILRKDYGYNGVVISDDMQMGAITRHYSFESALIKAINAGCDILILSGNGDISYRAVDIVLKAIDNNEISEGQIKKALNRIRILKEKLRKQTKQRQ